MISEGGDRLAAAAEPSVRKCPICGRPAEREYDPFCSKRCADVDLNRWLKGVYVIPGRQDDAEDEGQSEQ